MNDNEISSNLLSKDSTQILAGCFAIKKNNNKIVLQNIAEKILPKRAQIAVTELSGGLIPNKHWLDLAFIKLEISNDERCLCNQYLYSEFYDPEQEQSNNNVSIDQFIDNTKTWSSDRICRCLECGQMFEVHGETSWHVPWWKWSQT